MTRRNKSWIAVAAAILLLGVLVGVVWARPQNKPQAQDILRKVTLTGGDFIPIHDEENWYNMGHHVRSDGGLCYFTAPVVFPCLPSVTVERIKLHVNDQHGTVFAKAELRRANPRTGTFAGLGGISSPSDTSGGVKTYTSADINQVIWPSQKAYIWLYIGAPNIYVHGVTVEYRRNI